MFDICYGCIEWIDLFTFYDKVRGWRVFGFWNLIWRFWTFVVEFFRQTLQIIKVDVNCNSVIIICEFVVVFCTYVYEGINLNSRTHLCYSCKSILQLPPETRFGRIVLYFPCRTRAVYIRVSNFIYSCISLRVFHVRVCISLNGPCNVRTLNECFVYLLQSYKLHLWPSVWFIVCCYATLPIWLLLFCFV